MVASIVFALLLAVIGSSNVFAVTPRQIALGVSMNDSRNMANVDAYTTSLGAPAAKPAIWALWSDWGGPDGAFPTDAANGLRSRGIVPMINWEPIDPSHQDDCGNWSLDNIINGDHDAYIRQWASDAKAFGGRVIVRFAHEMNGYWYIWGQGRCTNTAAKFKSAWQHVVNIFRGTGGVGATNVRFLWSVFGTYQLRGVYPGGKYVDYMGFSAFDWGQAGHPKWTTMVGTFNATVRGLRGISTKKPIIAAEMGAGYTPSCATCNKVAYISTGYPAVYTKWPQIAAMVYFNIDMTPLGQPDWRLTSPSQAFDAYKAIANDSRFQGVIP